MLQDFFLFRAGPADGCVRPTAVFTFGRLGAPLKEMSVLTTASTTLWVGTDIPQVIKPATLETLVYWDIGLRFDIISWDRSMKNPNSVFKEFTSFLWALNTYLDDTCLWRNVNLLDVD